MLDTKYLYKCMGCQTKNASSKLAYRRFPSQNTRWDVNFKRKTFFYNKLMWKKFALSLLPTSFICCWESQVLVKGIGIFSTTQRSEVLCIYIFAESMIPFSLFLFLTKRTCFNLLYMSNHTVINAASHD